MDQYIQNLKGTQQDLSLSSLMSLRYVFFLILVFLSQCLKTETLPENLITGNLLIYVNQKKRAARKDRVGETQTWQLSRFYPIVEVLNFISISLSAVFVQTDTVTCLVSFSFLFRNLLRNLTKVICQSKTILV